MKLLVTSLLVLGFSLSINARADEATSEESDLHFMQNYDAKIANLENYTVTYVEAGQKAPAQDAKLSSHKGLTVQLVRNGR
jgi:hypothetical protein